MGNLAELYQPPPGPELELLARAKLDEMKGRRGPGDRPPKRPRFGLLRRLARLIRGGGD